MLYDSLRSQETLAIQLEDLHLGQAQLRVRGKGNKQRILPLPTETIRALENYLHLERPLSNSPRLLVSLQGPRRGQPMTPAGLRSLFRHHRRQTKIVQAKPAPLSPHIRRGHGACRHLVAGPDASHWVTLIFTQPCSTYNCPHRTFGTSFAAPSKTGRVSILPNSYEPPTFPRSQLR